MDSRARTSVVVAPGLQSTDSIVVAHGLSCSKLCGIFLDQGSNPRLLHWQVGRWILYDWATREAPQVRFLGWSIIYKEPRNMERHSWLKEDLEQESWACQLHEAFVILHIECVKWWQQAPKAGGTRFWQAKEADGSGEVGKLVGIIILKRKQGDQKKPISII